jgi:hypothetical protein
LNTTGKYQRSNGEREERTASQLAVGYKRYKKGIIRVSVGRDNQEKQVLLHELSHHLDTDGGHGSKFYSILKTLLIKYDCLTEEYKQRQYRYRKLSLLYL